MYGNRTLAGPEPADAGKPGDCGGSLADTFRILSAAKAALEARGEWRLGREIEDALARWQSEENPPAQFCIVCEGVCRGEEAHGEASRDAKVT